MSRIGTKPVVDGGAVTVKLARTGRGVVVRLPKEFALEGDSVLVRRVGSGVLLEPATKGRAMTHEEVQAFFARLDSYGADPLFPDGRDQGVAEERPPIL